MVDAILRDFEPPIRARVVADYGSEIAMTFRHPEGWTCRTTRKRCDVQLVNVERPESARAGRILDRLRDPGERYYLACAKADGRALLLELDGTAPRAWAGIATRLEELR